MSRLIFLLFLIKFYLNLIPNIDGKYLVLPSGELHIREVGPEDGYKSYQCRTKHRLTGETRLSATKGRLVITGKSALFANFFLPHRETLVIISEKIKDLKIIIISKEKNKKPFKLKSNHQSEC